jgi:two-component system response regulator AtoC
MSHLVWLHPTLGDTVSDDAAEQVRELLRGAGIDAVRRAPADAPDLVVRDWTPSEAPVPEAGDWSQAAAPAQIYLASEAHVPQLLARPFTDPLADVVLMPIRPADLAVAIARSLARRDQFLHRSPGLSSSGETADGGLVGESQQLKVAIALARQVASSPATSVLIQGESGTGKDLLARLVHTLTPGRRHRPFIALNCAAIPSDLLEAELFGFDRGAFTNAGRDKAGLMELAHQGTLFLDEVGELNVALQAKLLRVLETGTFRRLGGVTERHSECRVVASTNRNLLDAVQQGLFRLDLYHRLAVLTIHVPPVRERREDIMAMATQFLARFSAAMKKPVAGFSPTAQALLIGYPYPGNVRELRNIVERAVIVTAGPLIMPKDLGLELALMADTAPQAAPPLAARPPAIPQEAATIRWQQSLEETERQHIEQVLATVRGNRAHAARLLQISVPTLYKKMRKFNLEAVGR